MPAVENALLCGHDLIFLGERGQAKSRMIRALTGSPRRVDPGRRGQRDSMTIRWIRSPHTLARSSRNEGDKTEIEWLDRDAALRREARHSRRLDRRSDRRRRSDQGRRGAPPRSDEYTIHFGLLPRSATAASSASTSCPI